MDNIISIMLQSFNKQFYVDSNAHKDNQEYLTELTKKVLVILNGRECTYENIAGCIYNLDQQIRGLFRPCTERIVPLIINSALDWNKVFIQNFEVLHEISEVDKKRFTLLFETEPEDLIILGYKIWRIIDNIERIRSSDKQYILEYLFQQEKKLIENEKSFIWNIETSEDPQKDLYRINLLSWIASHKMKKVNHQKARFIPVFEMFDRDCMYQNLFPRTNVGHIDNSHDIMTTLLKKTYGISLYSSCSMQVETDDDVVTFIRQTSDNAKKWFTTTFFYSQIIRNYIYSVLERYDYQCKLEGEISKLRAELEKEKERKLDYITKLEQDNLKYERELFGSTQYIADIKRSFERELVSLRNYMFQSQKEPDDYVEVSEDESKRVYDYSEVTIIGGHVRWQQKILQDLKGIVLIGVDQNVLDFSFLNKTKLAVFVVNYLSHSMYYRVMENIPPETNIIYVKVRNVNQLKRLINDALTKNMDDNSI